MRVQVLFDPEEERSTVLVDGEVWEDILDMTAKDLIFLLNDIGLDHLSEIEYRVARLHEN